MIAKAARNSLYVPFGLKDDRLFEPLQVESGLACKCVCPGCGTPVIARHSPSGKRMANFAHAANVGCPGGLESAIHRAAKQLIADRRELYLPELPASISAPGKLEPVISRKEIVRQGELVPLKNVRLETMVGVIRPDIMVNTIDQEILVEIAYTHFISAEKLDHIRRQGIATIEVDVSGLVYMDFEALSKCLFEASDHSKWKYHPEQAARELELRPLLEADVAEDLRKWKQVQADSDRRSELRQKREIRDRQERIEADRRRVEARAQRIAKEIARPQDDKLADALALLGPFGSDIDMLLPIRVRGASSINAPLLPWQIVAFANLIHPALDRNKPGLSADEVRNWISEQFKVNTSTSAFAVVVWDFLSGLADLEVLHKVRKQEFLVAVPDIVGALQVSADVKKNHAEELVWSETWPSSNTARAVAEVFAKIYGQKAKWDQVAGLYERIRQDRTPSTIIAHYQISMNGSMNPIALRRYFLSAGFAQLAG